MTAGTKGSYGRTQTINVYRYSLPFTYLCLLGLLFYTALAKAHISSWWDATCKGSLEAGDTISQEETIQTLPLSIATENLENGSLRLRTEPDFHGSAHANPHLHMRLSYPNLTIEGLDPNLSERRADAFLFQEILRFTKARLKPKNPWRSGGNTRVYPLWNRTMVLRVPHSSLVLTEPHLWVLERELIAAAFLESNGIGVAAPLVSQRQLRHHGAQHLKRHVESGPWESLSQFLDLGLRVGFQLRRFIRGTTLGDFLVKRRYTAFIDQYDSFRWPLKFIDAHPSSTVRQRSDRQREIKAIQKFFEELRPLDRRFSLFQRARYAWNPMHEEDDNWAPPAPAVEGFDIGYRPGGHENQQIPSSSYSNIMVEETGPGKIRLILIDY